jgi:uncharacterized oligopeptide transporter (OPT) family protein
MPIHELTEEQVRTMSLEEKDRWWLTNVFRGNMPQLTLRSAITGMLLGGVLSLTNLYIGAKTGWTMGVGITSVILAYAFFKVISRTGLSSEFSILENNAMQSIATAAGYMTSPMISSMAAYMMVTGHVIPLWQMTSWIAVLAILGVLFAFPFKRRFINDEQQPFPEGRAAGVVMDALHHGEGRVALLKAKLLVGFAALAALVKLGQSEALIRWLSSAVGLLKRGRVLPHIPEFLDEWFYKPLGPFTVPTIRGLPVTQLTLRPELDLTMIGAGGLMGIRTGFSLLLGAAINYAILAPIAVTVWGEISDKKLGFRTITFWSLWAGVAMLTVASILGFFARPQLLISAFTRFFKPPPEPGEAPLHQSAEAAPAAPASPPAAKSSGIISPGKTTADVPAPVTPFGPTILELPGKKEVGAGLASPDTSMKDVELPLWVSAVGIPLLGALVVYMAWRYFGVAPWLGVVAVALVFVFCLIAINSTGLTSITPIGAMGKLTQLTFGVLAPGNVTTNLMSASITGEVASHSANLLQDIKPGYMLGAKPRQQAVGHVLGVIAGAALSVPVFYLLFLGLSREQTFSAEPSAKYHIDEDKFPMPSATVWKGVADVLTKGISEIPYMARWATLIALIVGIALEVGRLATKGAFPLSPIGLGLGFLIPFYTCFAMFLGSFLFWLAEKVWSKKESRGNQVIVQNQEPICAGLIAGGALMGILVMLLETLLPK